MLPAMSALVRISPAPTNLPAPASTFVGRARELEQLGALDGPIVTVLGPPGIGKTRLALEHARACGPGYDGGALFCDLSEARDRPALCAALADALGIKVPDATAPGALRRIGLALAERGETLLVLDNFEQLAEEAAVLSELSQVAPLTTLLVTSRERLGLAGEAVLALGPLGGRQQEAVALFVDRAQQARPGYAPSAEERERIGALCDSLDGLPLCIELAAARMRVMSLAQIEANLSRRFLLLARADVPDSRQSTLQRALDWSWALLSADERAALSQSAVFRGGFALEAAEAVLEGGAWIPDVLQSLCDRSLMGLHDPGQPGAVPRFGLSASVREYAEAHLEDSDRVRARHARYFSERGLAWSDELDLQGVQAGWTRLRAEAENLLTAHQFAAGAGAGSAEPALGTAVALGTLYARGGARLRYTELVSRSLSVATSAGAPPGLLARGLRRLGDFLATAGEHEQAASALHRAISLAEQPAPAVAVRCWLSLAKLELRKARHTAAEGLLQRAEALAQRAGDAHGELIVRNLYGALEGGRGNHARAAEHHRRALAQARRLGDQHLEGLSLSSLGDYEIERGNLAEARVYLTRALEIQREQGEIVKETASFGGLGVIALAQADWEVARQHFEQAARTMARMGDRIGQAWWQLHLGVAQQAADALDEALLQYDQVIELCEELGTPTAEIAALAWRASLRVRLGPHLDAARLDLDAARRKLDGFAQPVLEALVGVLGGIVEVSAARLASGPQAAAELAATLQARYAPMASTSYDVRLALRELQRATSSAPAPAAGTASALVVARGGLWFQAPGGERVELEQRRSLRLLLEALVRQRLAQPDTPLSSQALLEAGWPGERMTAEAGRTRLYSAVYSLRTLGLRSLLKKRDDGYLLDPSVTVQLQ
jgi:predicted ATPase/Tfp pilus assembly protein PilF